MARRVTVRTRSGKIATHNLPDDAEHLTPQEVAIAVGENIDLGEKTVVIDNAVYLTTEIESMEFA